MKLRRAILLAFLATTVACDITSANLNNASGRLLATYSDNGMPAKVRVFCDAPRGNLLYVLGGTALVVTHQPTDCHR